MGEATLTVTQDNFKTQVLQSKAPVIVDFWASWCAPCRAVAPILDELAVKYQGKVTIGKVNVDEHPGLAARYGIRSIPTLLFFKGGKMSDQVVGAVPKAQLKKKLDSLA